MPYGFITTKLSFFKSTAQNLPPWPCHVCGTDGSFSSFVSAFDLEREREWRKKEGALKVQIAQLEATLKADVGEKGSILDRLTEERGRLEYRNNINPLCTQSFEENMYLPFISFIGAIWCHWKEKQAGKGGHYWNYYHGALSLSNLFEDWTPVDFICGCLIFKKVAKTWIYPPALAAECHAPVYWWYMASPRVSELKKLTLNVRGPSYLGLTRSISWLLMPWLLTSPGHQQPWYWLCRIDRFLSYLRKDFNYLRRINVEKWHKMSIYVYVPSEQFST